MTFTTIADLLADPVLGKLEEVREYASAYERFIADPAPTQPYGAAVAISESYTAILAVANARGTCGECENWGGDGDVDLDGWQHCFCGEEHSGVPYMEWTPETFGCSLWEARTT